MWGGRGPTGAGGQKSVPEEQEPAEEREWQDEADKGQCASSVHMSVCDEITDKVFTVTGCANVDMSILEVGGLCL